MLCTLQRGTNHDNIPFHVLDHILLAPVHHAAGLCDTGWWGYISKNMGLAIRGAEVAISPDPGEEATSIINGT